MMPLSPGPSHPVESPRRETTKWRYRANRKGRVRRRLLRHRVSPSCGASSAVRVSSHVVAFFIRRNILSGGVLVAAIVRCEQPAPMQLREMPPEHSNRVQSTLTTLTQALASVVENQGHAYARTRLTVLRARATPRDLSTALLCKSSSLCSAAAARPHGVRHRRESNKSPHGRETVGGLGCRLPTRAAVDRRRVPRPAGTP